MGEMRLLSLHLHNFKGIQDFLLDARGKSLDIHMFPGIREWYEKAPDLLALALSILLAFGAGLDFFGMFGIPFSIPYVGIILSGFCMSGGTKLVHDIIEWVAGKQKELKEDYYM